ncbi:hypothetical protein [Vreelandella neptunia]|jgi:hypothetical protein|uniref:Uncharacterized protein n=1 Tax=Vreelandella neptunia TaxID=115551 RepID=A0ABS9SAI4_9GAMM|nr:hypothetical protein [Halomonas neptunia]MCH4813127.1 hypothetical protein [Halomonas neptunia]
MKIKMKKTKVGLSLNVKNFDTLVADIESEVEEQLFNKITVNSFERQGRRGLVVSEIDKLSFVASFDFDKKEMTLKEVYNDNHFYNLIKAKSEEKVRILLFKIANYSIGKAFLQDKSEDVVVYKPLEVA